MNMNIRAPSPKYLVLTLLATVIFYVIGMLTLPDLGRVDLFLNIAPVAIIIILGSYLVYRKKGGIGSEAVNQAPAQETVIIQPNAGYLTIGVFSILFSFFPGLWVFIDIASLITFPENYTFELLELLISLVILAVFLTLLLGGYWLVRKSKHNSGIQVVNILLLVIFLLVTGGAFVDLLF